ncbi:MAG: LLM class flavin-dependent oxidoreductase [Actinomycetota bacterium]|nr:LLM class flavin-dependent oxidoreductase [Actinomycetota bacterium]
MSGVKLGLTLPQFQEDPELCLRMARQAEAAGIDGAFAFDHLWAIGRPDHPALHGPSLVAALAVETQRLRVGTLVARVGLVPDDVLVAALSTLADMAGGRLVAGVGVGDQLSEGENRAYGVPFPSAAERRARLGAACRRLRQLGIETWVGGLSARTRMVGRAEADALNLWEVAPAAIASEVSRPDAVAVTWGGRIDVSGGAGAVEAVLRSLAGAGATWAVVAPVGLPWPAAVETVAEAAAVVR